MNVTLLEIIADECCANIRAGQVVAIKRAGDAEWQDPFGGVFDWSEQGSLDELARGNEVSVRLSAVDGRPRIFGARLAAKF